MPVTRAQKQSNDAEDLFEPPHHRRGARSTSRRAEKRPANEPPQHAKKKRSSARLEVSTTAAAAASKKPDDEQQTTSPSLQHDWQSDSTANTLSVIATVTPSSARVRRSLSQEAFPRLPEHVVDIFNADLGGNLTSSIWETSEKLMHNYITGFMHTYGVEYHQQLFSQEEGEYHQTNEALSGCQYLRYQFEKGPVDFDELLPYQPLLTMKMRHVLVAWLAEVVVEFKLSQAAYHLAISMLDELLLMGPSLEQYKSDQRQDGMVSDDESETSYFLIKPRNFQAVGCTCIWIASKIEDRTPPSSEQLSFISDNACSADSLLQFEAHIMELFNFRPLRVTPIHFLDVLERSSHASTADHSLNDIKRYDPQFHHMMEYILQLARPLYDLRLEKPSLVAAAACFLTRATLGLRSKEGSIWTPTLEFYSTYSMEALAGPVVLLLCSYMEAEHLNKPLFTLYKSSERCRVSLKTAPLIETLGFVLSEHGVNNHEHVVDIIDRRKKTFLDEV